MAYSTAPRSANDWTAGQRKFMAWLALPEESRIPLSQKRYASENNIHECTLSKWRALPGFMDEVQALITASLSENYNEVMHSFKKSAQRGSFPHQKMYFEMLGVYVERRQVDINVLREEAKEIAYALSITPEALDPDEVVAEADAILKERK